jgi:hypothetical protein
MLAGFVQRLAAAAATGPPLASAFCPDIGPKNSTVNALICAQQAKYGYLEPLDWKD